MPPLKSRKRDHLRGSDCDCDDGGAGARTGKQAVVRSRETVVAGRRSQGITTDAHEGQSASERVTRDAPAFGRKPATTSSAEVEGVLFTFVSKSIAREKERESEG